MSTTANRSIMLASCKLEELFSSSLTVTGTNSIISDKMVNYRYSSPMEKHLDTFLSDIQNKESELSIMQTALVEMNKCLRHNGIDNRVTCSLCHEKNPKHSKSINSKCLTSLSCGRMKRHKGKMKVFERKKISLKKLLCDWNDFETESNKVRETITSTNKCFSDAFKSYFINWKNK